MAVWQYDKQITRHGKSRDSKASTVFEDNSLIGRSKPGKDGVTPKCRHLQNLWAAADGCLTYLSSLPLSLVRSLPSLPSLLTPFGGIPYPW
jgi:hypothetical protein